VYDVERPAEAGVAVDDHPDADGPADPARDVQDLRLGEQSEVGLAEVARADRVAAENDGGEAGPLGELRAQHVPDAGGDDDLLVGDEGVLLCHGGLIG